MKTTKRFAAALVVSLMLISLTACGESANPAKDEFKDYVNNYSTAVFIPEENAIAAEYKAAKESMDEAILMSTLTELPTKCDALLVMLNEYKPETTEVQELHNLYTEAITLRGQGFTQMLDAFNTDVNDSEGFDTAFALATETLTEADAKMADFATLRGTMMTGFGLTEITADASN